MAFRAQPTGALLRGHRSFEAMGMASPSRVVRPGPTLAGRTSSRPTGPATVLARRGPPPPSASTDLGSRFGRAMTVPGLDGLRGIAESVVGSDTDELDIEVRDVKVRAAGRGRGRARMRGDTRGERAGCPRALLFQPL